MQSPPSRFAAVAAYATCTGEGATRTCVQVYMQSGSGLVSARTRCEEQGAGSREQGAGSREQLVRDATPSERRRWFRQRRMGVCRQWRRVQRRKWLLLLLLSMATAAAATTITIVCVIVCVIPRGRRPGCSGPGCSGPGGRKPGGRREEGVAYTLPRARVAARMLALDVENVPLSSHLHACMCMHVCMHGSTTDSWDCTT